MASGDETQAGPRPSLPPQRPAALGNAGSNDRGGFAPEEPLERFGADRPTTNFNSQAGGGGFPQQPIAGKPQILAPQANEWDDNQQEIEVVKGRRTGLVLLFLLALLLVALIALALAAYSVFSGGDPIDTSAQAGTEAGAEADDPLTDGAEAVETTIPVETTIDPNLLEVMISEQPFICDGEKRVFAQLSGGAPNEEIAFTSPQTANLASGTADANGGLPINWSCTPDQAGTTWELTASGVTSGKTVTFIFSGALAAEGDPAADPGAAPAALTVELIEDPFVCNSEGRVFGGLSGADPGEDVTFTSPQASAIKNGTADANGDLSIRWSCTPDQAGTVWELTATGVTSGRSVVFELTGG